MKTGVCFPFGEQVNERDSVEVSRSWADVCLASPLHPLMLPDLLIGLHLASEAEFCVADALTGRKRGGNQLRFASYI